MATSSNFLLKDLAGHLGKQLVIKQYEGKTVVSKYPDMSRQKFTDKQLHNQAMMLDANYEAKATMADVERRHAAQVRLNVTANKLYTALVREYFRNGKEAGE